MDAETARRIFTYDPETGFIAWRKPRQASLLGRQAGSIDKDGYRALRVRGRAYSAHRVAWLICHGQWPSAQIDHVNLDRADNRLSNLREADCSQNQANIRGHNSGSGRKGVTRHKCGRFQAQIKVRGKSYYLGLFDTVDEAHAAYVSAAAAHFGSFARAA